MKAGQTEFEVGTEIEVLSIRDTDPDEAIGVVGTIGEVTHPFGDSPDTVVGVWVRRRGTVPPGTVFPYNRISLQRGDTVKIVETGRIVTI